MTGKGKNDASCAAHISYIHPLSIVDEGSDIGSGTRVWAGAHVMTGAKIGQDCNIGEHCFVEGGVTIGDRVTVKNNVALIGKEYQKSTLSRYGNCYELLEIVIHEFYRKEYISFNELKGEFIDAFEMHLRIVRKLSQNTLTKYMSCFRKIMYQDELLLMWKYIKNHAVNVLI